MNKTIVCGDLHGKYEIVERLLELEDYDLVFVGDYLDSNHRDVGDQLRTISLLIDSILKYKGSRRTVVGLKGNHEMSYLDSSMVCSGYSLDVRSRLRIFGDRLQTELKPYCLVGDYLISHAGVSNKLLEYNCITLHQYLEGKNFLEIGSARGGYSQYGGLYWCDWWEEFEPIPGVKQVVGHSSFRPVGERSGIVTKGDNFNIDCLDRVNEVLVISEDGRSAQIMCLESIEEVNNDDREI